MATIFFKINSKLKYYIFDTYEVNLLQYYYLKKCNLDVGLGINNKNKIKLICDLNDLKNVVKKQIKNKNLFIANWSFSEISLNFRKKLSFFSINIFTIFCHFKKILKI